MLTTSRVPTPIAKYRMVVQTSQKVKQSFDELLYQLKYISCEQK